MITTLAILLAAGSAILLIRHAHHPCNPAPDLKTIPPLSVTLSLTDTAARRLQADHETIKVAAYFYGFPTSNATPCADEMGEIHLGKASLEVAAAGTVVLSGARYDSSMVPLLKNGDVKLLINVVSGRRSSPDNILECGVYEDSLAKAVAAGIHIVCDLGPLLRPDILTPNSQERPKSTTLPNMPLQPTVTRPPTGPSGPAGSRQRLNAGR